MDYKNAGVDIEAGYKSVELMKEHVKKTMRPEVLGGLGGFSGAFSLAKIKEMEEPVLLSGTDGCGTKVKLAMCRRRTAVLPRLHRMRKELSGEDRFDRKRRCRRLSAVRCGTDRR